MWGQSPHVKIAFFRMWCRSPTASRARPIFVGRISSDYVWPDWGDPRGFGVTPEPETLALFSQWKEVFDAFPVETSLAYHTFREWFGWEKVPVPTESMLQSHDIKSLTVLRREMTLAKTRSDIAAFMGNGKDVG